VIVRLQVTAFGRQRPAEVMQQLAKIGARLGFAGFRPQEICQLLARLRGLAVQQEIGQQRLQAIRVDREDGLLRAGDQQIIE